MKKGVIVIGGHVQGLGIIRILGRIGISCFLLDSNRINIARHSKYCQKFIVINKDQDFVQFLSELQAKYGLKDWLLVPTDDNFTMILSQNKKVLDNYFRVSVDEWKTIEKCYNKRVTYKIAQELKMEMPKTYFPNNLKEVDQLDIDFPCIIKPAIMHRLYSQIHIKVFVCSSKEELISNYKKILHYIPNDEVIVQEIIPGDSECQYSACFFYNRTEPIVSLLAKRKRQYPPDFGKCTTFAETIAPNSIIKNAEMILNKINYWGLCEVEFKKDERNGSYKFLEINPRAWKWHSVSNKSKSPFLQSLYHSIYFNEPIIKNEWDKACWKDLITDSFVLLKNPIVLQALSGSNEMTEFAVFAHDDLKPFVFELIYSPYLFLTR